VGEGGRVETTIAGSEAAVGCNGSVYATDGGSPEGMPIYSVISKPTTLSEYCRQREDCRGTPRGNTARREDTS
jgi:hypothetical protein